MEQAYMTCVHFSLCLTIIIIRKPRVAENLCAQRSYEHKWESQCKPGEVSFPEILQAQQ